MFNLSNTILKSSKCCSVVPLFTRFNNFSSSSPSVKVKSATENGEDARSKKLSSPMVAAAFASLRPENTSADIQTPFTDEKITKATTVDEVLSISEGSGVSRRHALKVVSILAGWSSSGKVNLSDFESDPRFTKLCRVLSKKEATIKSARRSFESKSEDLTTILSITADDEAAKLVGTLTPPQMVKVMTTLSEKKRRSMLLLRALAYHISGCSYTLNIKECGDLLYGMALLNFPDENMLTKIANDINYGLGKDVRKSSVIGSILTSLGLLKYKNCELLDGLSDWILHYHSICRSQDIFSLFMTLAVLNYVPINSEKLFEILIPQLNPSEARRKTVWLEIVWSLVLLNQANSNHISSVLQDDFLSKLQDTPSANMKLLNIDAAAEYLLKNYDGPRLPPTSLIRQTKLCHTYEKNEIVDSVLDSLKNLIRSENLLKTKVNTGLGFFIDAECLLDKKCSPLPVNQITLKNEGTRVALVVYHYHDMTRGRVEPTGVNVLASNLLNAQGYKVLIVPYTDFKPRDKLVNRVKYLESRLKEVVKS